MKKTVKIILILSIIAFCIVIFSNYSYAALTEEDFNLYYNTVEKKYKLGMRCTKKFN